MAKRLNGEKAKKARVGKNVEIMNSRRANSQKTEKADMTSGSGVD